MQEWKSRALELALTSGKSWRKIAKELGVSKSTVSDYLRKEFSINDIYNGVEDEKDGPSLLFIDIETRQLVLEGFGLFNQNFSLEKIAEDWSILSFSAKWHHADEIMYHDVSEMTEDELLQKIYTLFDKADFIVAHNGRRFDLKKIRARMIARGFMPHSPVRVIDTLEIAKKEFAFTSNKLEYLTKLLCKINTKSGHAKFPGFSLWREFVRGNPEAIQEMRDYNIIDVTSLEELYDILAPWSTTLPNFDVYRDEPTDLTDLWVDTGEFIYSNLGKYVKYRNVNTGQYKRGRVNLLTKEQRQNLLANIV